MDETCTRVSLDVSQRPYLIWQVNLAKPKLGEMDTELFKEWFQALRKAPGLPCMSKIFMVKTITILSRAALRHWRALRQAIEIDPRKADEVPSTKGVLGS